MTSAPRVRKALQVRRVRKEFRVQKAKWVQLEPLERRDSAGFQASKDRKARRVPLDRRGRRVKPGRLGREASQVLRA